MRQDADYANLFNIALEVLDNTFRQEKETNDKKFEKIKILLVAIYIIVKIKYVKESTN